MNRLAEMIRVLAATLALVVLGACTHGINAGEKGGQAFIAFAGMLIVTVGILWVVLGREK